MGTPLLVDEAFALKHEISAIKAPFKMIIPKEKNLFFLPGGKKTGTSELVKLTTATDDKKAREILRFTSLTVPLKPKVEERLAICAVLLKTKVMPMATQGYENARLLELYATKVGKYDAVSAHGEMTKPGTGETYWVKVIGIMPPGSPHGVMAFLMADKNLSDIKTLNDLSTTGFGLKVIHSVDFVTPQVGAPALAPAPTPAADGNAAALRVLVDKLLAAVAAEDVEAVAAVNRSLLPDEAELKAGLNPSANPEEVQKVMAMHASLPKDDTKAVARLIVPKPGQTVAKIHAATTEEIATYGEGTTAHSEFPGGAKTVARAGLLKPGQTYFEVEFLEPGKDAGVKYHLFYWNGSSFSMLGPVWRAKPMNRG
jgi:hypothetical protein